MPGRAQLVDREPRFARRVDAPERREPPVVEALRTERYTVDARRAVLGEARVLDGAGVRFERDLEIGARTAAARARAASSRSIDSAANRLGVPPPKNTEMSVAPPRVGGRELEILEQRSRYASLRQPRARHLVRVEVAVRALAHAPRQVDVQRERDAAVIDAPAALRRGFATAVSAATSARSAWPRWLTAILLVRGELRGRACPLSSTTNSGS